MEKYQIEKIWGDNPDDVSDSYYVVMSTNSPLALAAFDTKKQAEAFIAGLQYYEEENKNV